MARYTVGLALLSVLCTRLLVGVRSARVAWHQVDNDVPADSPYGTHYEALGVDPTASAEAIRKAGLRRVREEHPDKATARGVSPDVAARHFRAVQKARVVLEDPGRKASYDRALHRVQSRPTPAPSGPQTNQKGNTIHTMARGEQNQKPEYNQPSTHRSMPAQDPQGNFPSRPSYRAADEFPYSHGGHGKARGENSYNDFGYYPYGTPHSGPQANQNMNPIHQGGNARPAYNPFKPSTHGSMPANGGQWEAPGQKFYNGFEPGYDRYGNAPEYNPYNTHGSGSAYGFPPFWVHNGRESAYGSMPAFHSFDGAVPGLKPAYHPHFVNGRNHGNNPYDGFGPTRYTGNGQIAPDVYGHQPYPICFPKQVGLLGRATFVANLYCGRTADERCATQAECGMMGGSWKNKYCTGSYACGCCKEIGMHASFLETEDHPIST